MSGEQTPDLDRLRGDYDAAMYLRDSLSMDLEDAYQAGDAAMKKVVGRRIDAASRLCVATHDRWQAARRQAAPTFEEMLADPCGQYDRHGEVLASILSHQGVCMAPIEVRSNTASAGGVVPSSAYVCTKARPCPDHPASDDAPAADDRQAPAAASACSQCKGDGTSASGFSTCPACGGTGDRQPTADASSQSPGRAGHP